MSRGLALLLLVLVIGAGVIVDGAAAQDSGGRIGPDLGLTANGRALAPAGRLTTLGNFPTGGALTPDGRFYWTVDAGNGANDVKVVDVSSGVVVQTLPLPGGYVGVAFAPDGRRAYVSGAAKGSSTPAGPTKGDAGDVVHVFDVDPATGLGTERDPLAIPTTMGGSGRINSLTPTQQAYPEGLAVSADGRRLIVALNQADRVAIFDLASGSARTAQVGAYPADVAIDPSRAVAYVSNEYSGTVSVVDLDAATELAQVSVGGPTGDTRVGGPLGDRNAHPEGLALDAQANRLYVAVANRDLIAVVDTTERKTVRYVSVGRPEGLGTSPVAVALSPDRTTLYATDAGEDAIAAIALVDRPVAGSRARARAVSAVAAADRPGSYVSVPSAASVLRYRAAQGAASRVLKRKLRSTRSRGRRRKLVSAYARRVRALRRRYLLGGTRLACSGPTRVEELRYTRAVLDAAVRRERSPRTARGRKRRAAVRRRFASDLRRARAALPTLRACSPGTSATGGGADQGPIAGEGGSIRAFTVIGRIPTAAYPTDVQVTADGRHLVWLAGKGLGGGPNPQGPNGDGYVLRKLIGRAGVLDRPSDTQVQAITPTADRAVHPQNGQAPPAGTPVVRPGGGASDKIKYVFYITRENRTYDQIFGSQPRGDGDARLELFDDNGVPGPTGGVTPNAHALARKFPLLDHLYADSEVSIDGHTVTGGGFVTDYMQKSVAHSYADRGRSYDFGLYPVSFPPNHFLFDQATRQGVSFRDYGEADNGNVPGIGDDGRPTYQTVLANTDQVYPTNAFIGCTGPGGGVTPNCVRDAGQLGSTTSFGTGQSRFNQFRGEFEVQLASGTVPRFNYILTMNDHTNGTTQGAPTPKALVAENDLAIGQIVDEISHSSIWGQSVIFIQEDDSQDGADHVDAHRMPAFVISPWTKQGAVVPTRYDQYSIVRTAGLILGLSPLSLADGLATPMYDVFRNDGQADVEGTRYTAIQPQQSFQQTNGAGAPNARLSGALPYGSVDAVPQAISDRILWQSVHGASSTPPSPGPGASAEEHERATQVLRIYRRGGDLRRYLREGTRRNG